MDAELCNRPSRSGKVHELREKLMVFPTRQKWAESFGEGRQLWLLASAGNEAMYYTKDDPNDDPRGRSPLYHVWNGDRWLFTGASRSEAERAYAEARKDSTPI